jgi:hypothetical protein
MTPEDIRLAFEPVIEKIFASCALTDHLADKEMFQIYIATVWGNAALDPRQAGLCDDDLSLLHDYLNEVIHPVLGNGSSVTSCFEFLDSKRGQEAMERFQLTKRHKEFLAYFTAIVLATR